MAYKGKFTPKNEKKYIGDSKQVVYRSLWERNAFRWLDTNPNIVSWSSEEIVVPYVCGTDNKVHRYFVDLWFKNKEGKTYLVEIKPKKELLPPKKGSKQTKRFIQESLTFIKNQSKWKAAQQFALDQGWEFHVWTEETLESLGIKLSKK